MGLRRRLTNLSTAITPSGDRCANENGSSEGLDGRIGRPADERGSAKRKRRRRLLIECLGQRRVLAVITGTVFEDADVSLRAEPGEQRLESRLAFIDTNENGVLDSGEPTAFSDSDGRFEFQGLGAGVYPVHLFDGAATPGQTFPTGPSEIPWIAPSDIAGVSGDAIELKRSGDALYVLTENTLVVSEFSGTSSTPLELDFKATELVAADIGRLIQSPASNNRSDGSSDDVPIESVSLVAGTASGGQGSQSGRNGLWLVPGKDQVSRELIQGAEVTGAAIGPDGKGVLLSPQGNANHLHSLSFYATTGNGQGSSVESIVSATTATVPLDAQVLAGESNVDGQPASSSLSSRTVVAWPNDLSTTQSSSEGALAISLWSNAGSDWISQTPTFVLGASELVSFDDEAGLLAIRYQHGGIGVLDVDAGFLQLHDFPDLNGTVALIPGADALAAVNTTPVGAMFTLRDLRSGNLLMSEPLELDNIESPLSIVAGETLQSAFVLGSAGISKIDLGKPAAHKVVLDSEDANVHIQFGVKDAGGNQPPTVASLYDTSGDEDSEIKISPADLNTLVSDPDQDKLATFVVREPANGTAVVGDEGQLSYQPNPNFNGVDSFAVKFHDGQALSETLQVSVAVAAVPDLPSGVNFVGEPIPEHTVPEYSVGSIDIVDVDSGDDYDLDVSDSRFEIRDGELVFVSGSLDFEFEPNIVLTISGIDLDARGYFDHEITVLVEDENDPILELYADDGQIRENEGGQGVTFVSAEHYDDFGPAELTYTVDDDRFEVIDQQVVLKSDQMVDYESEPEIILTVTADDGAGSTLSTEVKVVVLDMPEEIGEITLSDQTVPEWEPGAEVGEVQVDGGTVGTNWDLTVNDGAFEIVDSTLKLVDGTWLERNVAEQVQIEITASDTTGAFDPVSAVFVIEVLGNGTPFHNDDDPYDVDGNGAVTPLDALAIINYLNVYGPGPVGPGDPGFGYDVNGDGEVTALDALLVINYLNTMQNGGTVGNGGTSGRDGEADGDSGTSTNSGSSPRSEGVDNVDPSTDAPQDFITPSRSVEGSSFIGPVNDPPRVTQDAASTATGNTWDPASGSLEGGSDWLNEIRSDQDDEDMTRAIDELLLLLASS